jgi:predicted transcriptional regulator
MHRDVTPDLPRTASRIDRDVAEAWAYALKVNRDRIASLPPGPSRARAHRDLTRSAVGVLCHCDDEADREAARDTLRDLADGRYRKRVARIAEALERAGATIPPEAIAAAAAELAGPAAAQTIAEAEAGRLRAPKAAA